MPRSPESFTPPEAIQSREPVQPEKQTPPAMEYGELTETEKRKLEIINDQFNNPKFVEIESPGVENKKIKVEYVVLDARNADDMAHAKEMNDRTVIHIPGFGSSYRANEHYEKLMALKENKRVIVVSQPSTGQSDDAPDEWRKWSRKERTFDPISEVLNSTIDAIRKQEAESGEPLTTAELSVSSSSLGSMYAVDLAVKHPDKVKDLVLMHPAGVYEEHPLSLGKRYAPETIAGKGGLKAVAKNWLPKSIVGGDDKSFKDMDPALEAEMEKAYKDMFGKTLQEAYEEAGGQGQYNLNDAGRQDYEFRQAVAQAIMADSGKNVGRKSGLKWRAWEALTIAKGGLLKQLPKVKANVYVMYGRKDKLFPASQMERVKGALTNAESVQSDILATHHDDIYQDARGYTGRVGGFFDKMRAKEKQEEHSR